MRKMRASWALAGVLTVALAGTSRARAADGVPAVDPCVEAGLAKLEAPPKLESVLSIVHCRAVARDRATALRVTSVLWHAGGHASAAGLLALARHDDLQVRATALKGVAHVGLRLREGMKAVRDGMVESVREVREAAFEAIGRVGDAEDVPALLEATRSTEIATRQAAFRALTALTDQRIPWDASRWSAWWDEARTEMPRRLDAALDALVADGCGRDAELESARSVVRRYGWMSLGPVAETVQQLLRCSSVKHRAEGFRLAAALRLGFLAEEVSSAFRYERHPDVWPAGRESAVALGTPTAGTKAPEKYVPDLRNDR